jgi:hypothetical protein
MFTLRKAQSEALEQSDKANMVNYQIEALRDEIPEVIQMEADDLLRQKVSAGIERAHKHAFFSLEEVTQFLVLMFTRVPHFDQHEPFQTILSDHQVPVAQRLEQLLDEAHERVWYKLTKRRTPEQAWFE